MSISMSQASLPVIIRALNNLEGLLAKAKTHVDSQKLDEAAIVNFRLFPDMLPFAMQIRIACDISKGCGGRLSGIEVPKFEDNETTLEQLIARVQKTLDFLSTVEAARVDGSEDKEVVLSNPRGTMTFTGLSYLQQFVLPNLYFHSATAYGILRHNGVAVGKMDFLGKVG